MKIVAIVKQMRPGEEPEVHKVVASSQEHLNTQVDKLCEGCEHSHYEVVSKDIIAASTKQDLLPFGEAKNEKARAEAIRLLMKHKGSYLSSKEAREVVELVKKI